jgi:DNA-binding PadR family transcriptional regulator
VKSELQQSNAGPQRKYYSLTHSGKALLTEFTQRNIQVFETPAVAERIANVVQNSSQHN